MGQCQSVAVANQVIKMKPYVTTKKSIAMKPAFSLLLLALLTCTGCASIVSNSAYPLLINSTPAGADFVIQNRNGMEIKRGQTPSIVILEGGAGYFKRAVYTVRFSKQGYEPQVYKLISRMNGWYWGNLINPIGMVLVDPATGAMWRLPPKLNVELPPKNPQ